MAYETLGQKIRRGWSLTRGASRILRGHPRLLVLPGVSFIATAVCVAGYAKFGLHLEFPGAGLHTTHTSTHSSAWSYAWLLAYLLVVGLIQTFIFGMVTASVLRLLSGQKATLAAAARAVIRRWKTLAQFSIYSSGVGFVIATIDRLPVIGNALSFLSGITWSVVNAFGVPVIMDTSESLTPIAVTRRSARVLREGWGEGATFKLSIWLIGATIVVGSSWFSTGLAVLLIALLGDVTALTVDIIFGFVALLIIAECLFFGLISAITKVALYIYATDGQANSAFDQDVLRATITARRARKIFS